jgi:predicted dehydrogenase
MAHPLLGDMAIYHFDTARYLLRRRRRRTGGRLVLDAARARAPTDASDATDLAALMAEFVACVRARTAPQAICSDNVESLAMVQAAIESARHGVRVDVEVRTGGARHRESRKPRSDEAALPRRGGQRHG